MRPQVYARVYLSENSPGERPWFWTVSDKDMGIATGYVATADDAIEAVDRTYADWLESKTGEVSKAPHCRLAFSFLGDENLFGRGELIAATRLLVVPAPLAKQAGSVE